MADRTITFGKYKGQPIKKLLLEHTGYILWCLTNLKWFKLDNEEQALYDAMAITIIRDKPDVVYPREALVPFIKDKDSLQNLKSPFYLIGTAIYPYSEEDTVVKSVLYYRKPTQRLDMSGLVQAYSKQTDSYDDFNNIDTDGIDYEDFM